MHAITDGLDIDIRDAFFEEIYNLAKNDRNILFLTADMGAYSLEKFKRDLPLQYINVGVAEQNLVSVAAGLALGGKKVYVYSIASFVTERCFEQIKIDLAGMRLPVVIIGSGPGITYNSDGPTHHAIEDVAIMRTLPGMIIFNPCDSISAKKIAEISYKIKGPAYVRLDKGRLPLMYDLKTDFLDGMALLKKGSDVLIVSTGIMVHQATKTADILEKKSISAGVLDIYRLKPVNNELLLKYLSQFKRIATIEEHTVNGGLATIVNEQVCISNKNIPVMNFSIPDCYCNKYGDRDWMHVFYNIDVNNIAQKILNWNQNKNVAITYTDSELKIKDFAELFGTTINDIPKECIQIIDKTDFHYSAISGDEYKATILDILKKIDSGKMNIAGEEKREIWNKGWSENLSNFITKTYDLEELVPKYYRPGQLVRLRGAYVKGRDPNFEYNFFRVLRTWLFIKYLKEQTTIYEFGCGPGHNLVALAKLYPDKELFGLDWANSSIELINNISKVHKFNIEGMLFDMFHPDENIYLKRNSAVITIGVLEQVGSRYEKFMDYLLKNRPELCINVEPLYEFYDEKNIFDYIAIKYHDAVGFLKQYLNELKKLERDNKLEILRIQRMHFGGLYTDGWSYVVWKPK